MKNICADCGKKIGQGRARCFRCSLFGGKTTGGKSSGAVVVENPANGYQERHPRPWLWTLLFGSFYFAVKGIWRHAVLSFVLAIFTAGLSWLVYPFFARGIVKKHYQRQGWRVVQS